MKRRELVVKQQSELNWLGNRQIMLGWKIYSAVWVSTSLGCMMYHEWSFDFVVCNLTINYIYTNYFLTGPTSSLQ